MTKLIDADALLEDVKVWLNNHKDDDRNIFDVLNDAPTVQREGWVSVPIKNIEMVKHHADFQVTVGFKSCRAAGEFKQALEAAPRSKDE